MTAAACCPLVLDATPVQCVPIEYNITTGGAYLIQSFTCRGKVLPPLPDEDRRLVQTALALVGVVGPICFILAAYALTRLYRRWRTSKQTADSESFLDDTDTTKDDSDDAASSHGTAGSYEVPEFRPAAFQAEGEMVAFVLSRGSSDDNDRTAL